MPFSRTTNQLHRVILYLVILSLAVLVLACTGSQPVSVGPDSEPTETLTAELLTPAASTATVSLVIPLEATPTPTNPQTAEVTLTVTPLAVTPAAITPQPPDEPIFGIEVDAISAQGGLGLLTGSGAHWVRRNALLWSDVEYFPYQRNWQNLTRLEAELQNAAEQGLQTILIVRSTPPFARMVASSACGPVAPEFFEFFANFMADAVSRYSQPPYNVRYWEIGNEPDIDPSLVQTDSVYGCWGNQGDPYYGGRHYAEMLKVVYPRIKAANPQARVLVGGLLLDCDPDNPPEIPPGSGQTRDCSSARFLEGILEAGGGAYFDAVSFHAYDYYGEALGRYGNLNWFSVWNTTSPVLQAKVQFLNNLLARYGWGAKPLLNTEVALICASSPGLCAAEDFELTKAYYAAQVNASALAAGLKANLWYSLHGWRDSGLVGPGNTPNLAYTAYAASLERLDGAAYTGPLDLETGLMGYTYTRQGTVGWIVWAVDETAHNVTLPQTPDQVLDVFGEQLPTANPLELGIAPVYIEWYP